MKEELSLNCPYKVILNKKDFIYSFLTSKNIEYKIIFSDASYFFQGTSIENLIVNVYSLTIEKVTSKKEPLDNNVQLTIDCIITHFFENYENSLIYFCDNSDSRELARQKKFNSWYDNSGYKVNVLRIDETITSEDGDTLFYTTMMYRKDNPFEEMLRQGYYEVVNTLKDK